MTKLYSVPQINSDRDEKELGELRAAYYSFKKLNDRSPEIFYNEEADVTLSMGVNPMKLEVSSKGLELNNPEYDHMWRHYDKEAQLTDIGRRIDLSWTVPMNHIHGSMSVQNIWFEEIRALDTKFYEDSESENADLKAGNWSDVVEAHLVYFSDLIQSIMRKHRDALPVDEARAIATLAICEFAKKIEDDKEDLRSRFATAAYSWVRNYYRDALDAADVIASKSLQKVQDVRTLTDLIKELNANLDYTTLEDICNASGFGERRVNSTFRVFDFNVNAYRDPNEEELLYTVMNEVLTERQATILEKNFGLGGLDKHSIGEIAEELNVTWRVVQYDREKAMSLIKDKLAFKYENKS